MNAHPVLVAAFALHCLATPTVASADAAAELASASKNASLMAAVRKNSSDEEMKLQGMLMLPAEPSQAVLDDPASKKAYLDTMQRYFAYKSAGYAYRSRVFDWQLFSGKMTFAIVIGVVLAGLYFSAVQFHAALALTRARIRAQEARAAATSGATQDNAAQVSILDPMPTKFSFGPGGLAVESSVIGVIILALSLVFFYLYLVHVYPITNVV